LTFVRGSNPVWLFDDLTGHLLDDQFYMFVLSNEIPYGPLPIYQDPFGNVEWTNPLQFYANGTLPNNVYFDPDTVYRIEIRQGDSQSDALIYLVENYVPGSSGNTPINETSFSTDNQVSNPQFALINFTSPLTLNSVSTQIINVAPGWFLNLTGTGNVTLTQVLLNSAVVNPTNASYALQIQLSGSWTNAYLSQRFTKNGVLWSNSFVSSSIMALSGNAPQNISATLIDSQGNTLTTVLNTTPLTEVFNAYPGIGQIGASMDTDFPPTAYIEYQLLLPNNCNITLSSVQLISGDVNIEYPYEQTTIERQIDQTYHNAYPIVPVGTVIDYGGFFTPKHYLACDGTAISRAQYQLLFQAMTNTETVTLNSSTSFTVSNGSIYRIGMPVEGTGIPVSTTISNISGNTITISNAATITGPSLVRFFAAGNGDGSTTFNVYDFRDYVIAGNGGTGIVSAPNDGLGGKTGASTIMLTGANLPVGTPYNPLSGTGNFVVTNTVGLNVPGNNGGNAWQFGIATSFSNVQLTAFLNKCIRYE